MILHGYLISHALIFSKIIAPKTLITPKTLSFTNFVFPNEWVNYPQSFFENNYMHMKGHLPRYIRANLVGWKYLGDGSWDLEGVCTSFLVSKLAKCKP